MEQVKELEARLCSAEEETYPYSPPVREMPPNDIPLIFKSRTEFPAGSEDWVMAHSVLRRGRHGSGVAQ